MTVELLYFDGCPTWELVKAEIEEMLPMAGGGELRLVKVTTNAEAQRLRFPSSPTVRVGGVDAEPDAPTDGFNLECRLYWVDGRPQGRPPHDLLERALRGVG